MAYTKTVRDGRKAYNIHDYLVDWSMNTVYGTINNVEIMTEVTGMTGGPAYDLVDEYERIMKQEPYCYMSVSQKQYFVHGTKVNNHVVKGTHTENLEDGTVRVTGFVDGEFLATYYKAASLDEQGKLHHGKPWLRTAREGLVAEYERNHKATNIVTYQAEKKANVGLAMCDEEFREDLVAKGIQKAGTNYTYLDRPIRVGDNVTQFEVMNRIKEINAEVNDEVAEFFRNFGA